MQPRGAQAAQGKLKPLPGEALARRDHGRVQLRAAFSRYIDDISRRFIRRYFHPGCDNEAVRPLVVGHSQRRERRVACVASPQEAL
jgi:hypothetical protein